MPLSAGYNFDRTPQAMKQLYSILIIILLVGIDLMAQTELPSDESGAFISDSKGFRIIKSTMTYDSDDYLAERYYYFDTTGLNFKTVDFYKGAMQGIHVMVFNGSGRLTGYTDYGQWITTYDPSNRRYLDSTLVSGETRYQYNAAGKLTFRRRQSYDKDQKPEYRQELTVGYNEKGHIFKIIEHTYDLSNSKSRSYLGSGSTGIVSNQSISANSVDLNIYKYSGDTITIENYRQNDFKTVQKIIRKDLIEEEFLFDNKGHLLRTTTRTYNQRNDLTEETCIGDCEISKYGEYGEGITYDRIVYKYSSTGLLLKKTFIKSKYNSRMYIDYEYFE